MSGESVRIAELRWERYALPFAQPFATASGSMTERHGFVLRLRDGQGRWGVGEAAPLPDFGGETLSACAARLATWGERLPGRTILCADLPVVTESALEPALEGAHAQDDTGADAPCAQHALECALHDLLTQARGIPLARGLHPAAAEAVRVNATLGAVAPEVAAAAARQAVAQGYRTLKLKVGVGGTEADAARLAAVRAAVGPGVRLRIDANGAWTRNEAAGNLERWAAHDLEYVEQPLAADDVEGMAWLATRVPVPLAADECLRSAADAERVLALGAAAVLVLKPMLLGGAGPALRICRLALAAGASVVITTVLEGAYGRLAALHTAAAAAALHAEAGREMPDCGLATGSLLARDLMPAPPGPERGQWHLPAAPGLGLA